MATKKKITIKPISHAAMDPNYAENTWKLLKNAIHEIHKKNASGLSFEELYRNSYNMVLHKYGDKLYNNLKLEVDSHLKEIAEQVASSNDEQFLAALHEAWSEHTQSMLMIRDILMYMDRVYVTNNNVSSVFDLGLILFRDNVSRHLRIKPRLLNALLDAVKQERSGEVINKSIIKNITKMLVELGVNSRSVYEEDFEKAFLESSSAFYKVESQTFIFSNSASEYMKKVEIRLREEVERVALYLDTATDPKIKEVVERELITAHMKTLVEMEGSGMISMLKDDKIEDLTRLYTLLGRVGKGHELMRQVMGDFVRNTGKEIVEDPENQNKENNTYVQMLLDLKQKYDSILVQAMGNNDKNFQHTLNQAFEYFINLNPRSPEYISLFIDDKLRRGLKGIGEEEIEHTLDKVMELFRYIQERDIFERYYKQHLARRLLLGRTVSDDAERSMISKLKTECGYQFTSKLEGMFQDMKNSLQTIEGFKNYLNTIDINPLKGMEINVQVLTTGFWPTQNVGKCQLPPEIVKCCEVFQKYYHSLHNGRRLTWQTTMGTAELRAFFGKKRHELNVSTHQMVLLLLFNNNNTLSFKDIQVATGIPGPDLHKSLLPLLVPAHKILNKNPPLKKFLPTDEFSFNDNFKSKLFRVKVMQVVQKETEPQRGETQKKIDEDRKIMIDAAIVRTMKSRKSMQHANLIAEVTKQLSSRFRPNPLLIKKNIESLIERDYLERSSTDRKVYNYLA